jgi:hypothetical protein
MSREGYVPGSMCLERVFFINPKKESLMKKMTLALIAVFALVSMTVEARRYYGNYGYAGSCSSCNTCNTCAPAVATVNDCAEVPQCFEWRKVPVCAQKHIYYTCPETSNVGPCDCSAEEKQFGGSAKTY